MDNDNLVAAVQRFGNGPVVQCWQLNNRSPVFTEHTVLPSACLHLVFPIAGQILISGIPFPVDQPFVAPVLSDFKNITIQSGSVIFGIHLQPYFCSELFGCSPSGLVRNAHFMSDVFSPQYLSGLKDAILRADDFDGRITAVLKFFDKSFYRRETAKQRVINSFIHLTSLNTDYSIRRSSGEIGYSTRWLQKVHKELTGISPGEMIRIIRFNKLLNKLYTSDKDVTRLALDSGYYDQAHAIREFKRLGGLTPGNFARLQPSLNKVLNYR